MLEIGQKRTDLSGQCAVLPRRCPGLNPRAGGTLYENSVSSVLLAHSAVMSIDRVIYVVEDKTARGRLAISAVASIEATDAAASVVFHSSCLACYIA